eukprot:scaffold7559_cov167-Amphora_coffeaeformis.AAC.5
MTRPNKVKEPRHQQRRKNFPRHFFALVARWSKFSWSLTATMIRPGGAEPPPPSTFDANQK